LNILPDRIFNVGGETVVDTDLIEMDEEIVARLRKV
jgi:hypothetical protein